MQSDDTSDLAVRSPSFSAYSSSAVLAVRIARESNDADGSSPNEGLLFCRDDEDEFEFALFPRERFESFPIFDRNLLRDDVADPASSSAPVSLMQLFINEERDAASSSDDEEQAGPLPGKYCVWRPKSPSPAASPGRCEKSKSTGSRSKRWRLKDLLLRRSNSDGKDAFVFLTPPAFPSRAATKAVAGKSSKGKAKGGEQMLYQKKNREGDKRKSYLPYRQDLVGLGFFR